MCQVWAMQRSQGEAEYAVSKNRVEGSQGWTFEGPDTETTISSKLEKMHWLSQENGISISSESSLVLISET